jgi:hypothetical protein
MHLLAQRSKPVERGQGIAVFLLREEAVRRGFEAKILRMIEQSGFEILSIKQLLAAKEQRSSDSNSYVFATPGGKVATCVVAHDRQPISPTFDQRRAFPYRTNARTFVVDAIRAAVLAYVAPIEMFNPIHASCCATEAWELIEMFAPEIKQEIEAQIVLGTRSKTDPLAA